MFPKMTSRSSRTARIDCPTCSCSLAAPIRKRAQRFRGSGSKGLGPEKAAEHRRLHDLGEVPAAIADFNEFYEARRERLLGRLGILLGTKMGVADDGRG